MQTDNVERERKRKKEKKNEEEKHTGTIIIGAQFHLKHKIHEMK